MFHKKSTVNQTLENQSWCATTTLCLSRQQKQGGLQEILRAHRAVRIRRKVREGEFKKDQRR